MSATPSRLSVGSAAGLCAAAAFTLAFAPAATAQCVTVPSITDQPARQTAPIGRPVLMLVDAVGGTSFQWRKDGQPLRDSASMLGSRTDQLMIPASTFSDAGSYDVVVRNPCGALLSEPAELRIRCHADLDDGTSSGNSDGGVDISDLLYFIRVYEQGWTVADLDDGTGTGQPDGGVGIEDLMFYLDRFGLGC